MKSISDFVDSFVNEYTQLVCRPTVRVRDVEAVQTWFDNHQYAIAEDGYIKCRDDLIPVHPKNISWFRNVLEKTSVLQLKYVKKFLSRDPSGFGDIDDGTTVWQDDNRVEKLSFRVMGFVGLGMLIGPLWWLNYLSDSVTRLGVITGFIVLFYVVVYLATTARTFEVLAAAAAYSAVLMVFMQIQQPLKMSNA